MLTLRTRAEGHGRRRPLRETRLLPRPRCLPTPAGRRRSRQAGAAAEASIPTDPLPERIAMNRCEHCKAPADLVGNIQHGRDCPLNPTDWPRYEPPRARTFDDRFARE